MGGLARRATFTKQFLKEHAADAVFQVDAGGLFDHRAGDPARSRAVLDGISRIGVDIANLTPGDAAELDRLGVSGKIKQPQFVSANVFGPGHAVIAPPFVVRRASGGTRMVFIGVSAAGGLDKFGYTVERPQETLKRLLPQVSGSADLVVLLAYMPNREVVEIAADFQNVDIIVSGYDGQFGIAPYQIGHAWVLQAQYEGRFVGQVALQMNAEKHVAKLEPNALVVLDSTIPDDPEMAALIAPVKPKTP